MGVSGPAGTTYQGLLPLVLPSLGGRRSGLATATGCRDSADRDSAGRDFARAGTLPEPGSERLGSGGDPGSGRRVTLGRDSARWVGMLDSRTAARAPRRAEEGAGSSSGSGGLSTAISSAVVTELGSADRPPGRAAGRVRPN
ncbi:MAG: hypothetical protein QOG57_987, partial [Pseudonocardiales bacterium]|nr:hypothetical protein [Pseudonocardiales bacterium]